MSECKHGMKHSYKLSYVLPWGDDILFILSLVLPWSDGTVVYMVSCIAMG